MRGLCPRKTRPPAFLSGQILWGRLAALYAVILLIWFGFRTRLGGLGFYLLFALKRHRISATGGRLSGIFQPDYSSVGDIVAGVSEAPRLRWGYLIGVCGYD